MTHRGIVLHFDEPQYAHPHLRWCVKGELVSCPINKHTNARAIFSPDKLGTEKWPGPKGGAAWGR